MISKAHRVSPRKYVLSFPQFGSLPSRLSVWYDFRPIVSFGVASHCKSLAISMLIRFLAVFQMIGEIHDVEFRCHVESQR